MEDGLGRVSEEDRRSVEALLGRPARGLAGIARRDARGRPAVLVVDPLADGGRPFPTLYWLVHGGLCREIAALESAGMVGTIEAEVARDPGLRGRLLADTEGYRRRRWGLLASLHDLPRVDPRYRRRLRSTGIGGIGEAGRIKCLHLHYAHHLACGNVVGALLEERFGLASLMN